MATPDVTTFFNDRFHPVFEAAEADSLQFFTPLGCPLTLPLSPGDADQVIAVSNLVALGWGARNENSPSLTFGCPPSVRYTPASE